MPPALRKSLLVGLAAAAMAAGLPLSQCGCRDRHHDVLGDGDRGDNLQHHGDQHEFRQL